MRFLPFARNTSKEIDILKHDVGVFKNLIKERQHPLDLVRELLSNAGARQVGATRIEISYTRSHEGHIFEVSDDGCGMNFSNEEAGVGRLAKFLGLGLSRIVGESSDEFSWKGLGSKLAYQSRRVVIETKSEGHPLYEVRIDEPWESLCRNVVPRPRITEHDEPHAPTGTRIKVFGHPPHHQDRAFTLEEIRRFLLHRTFVGFTRPRGFPPRIVLSVLGRTERVEFGFPEHRGIVFPEGLELDRERKTLLVNLAGRDESGVSVRIRGILTWEPERFGLGADNLNVGLILSSRGIPYFELPLAEYGAGRIAAANPGRTRTCLLVECDGVYTEMNLSRSGLVDSETTVRFRDIVRGVFERLEASGEYRRFRELRQESRRRAQAARIAEDWQQVVSDDQTWVVLERPGMPPRVLLREPRNEAEVIDILGKLESLGALPFRKFRTVALPKTTRGPDLLVNFQEEPSEGPGGIALFKAANKFYSCKRRDQLDGQAPSVICWDIPRRGRRVRLERTDKKYKFVVDDGERSVPVYVMKYMDGLRVLSTRELRERGIDL